MTACPGCGWMLKDTDTQCSMCGHAMAGGGAPAAPPAVPRAAPGYPAPPPIQTGSPSPYAQPPRAPAAASGGFTGAAAAATGGSPWANAAVPTPNPQPQVQVQAQQPYAQAQPAAHGQPAPPPAYPPPPQQSQAGYPQQVPPVSPAVVGHAMPPPVQGHAPAVPAAVMPPPIHNQGAMPPPVVQGMPPPVVQGMPPPPPAVPPIIHPGAVNMGHTADQISAPKAIPGARGAPVLIGFLVTFQNEPMGKFWPLRSGRTVLGRAGVDNEADVALQDASASARHAVVQGDPSTGQAFVEDAGSRNGTFVNEQKLAKGSQRQLHDNDRLRLGSITLVVKLLAQS